MKTVPKSPDDLAREIENPPAESLVTIGVDGIPVIRCRPDAPATRMSLEELLELEQESQAEEDSKRAGVS